MQHPPVTLPAAVYAAIVAHARERKPEEICGVLRGRDLEAYEAVRGRNIAAERIENYDVDPQTLLLQFDFEEAGDAMMGIYHSHPVSVAYPSATDAWNANYPDAIYFICSLEHDDAPVIRAYRLVTHFLDLDVPALRRELNFYETRPGLFAWYQPAEAEMPAALTGVAAQTPAPFYIVHLEGDEPRVVTVAEHPIVTH